MKKKSKIIKKKFDLKPYKKIITLSAIGVVILIVMLLVYPVIKGWTYAKRIPAMPVVTEQTRAVSDYLYTIHAEALDNPASDEAVGKLGMAFHANFFYDLAAECYNLAYELNDDQWRWLYNQALITEELGDTEKTISLLKEVVDLEPDITPAWFRLGNSYLKLSSFDDATAAFNETINAKEFSQKDYLGFELPNKGAFPLKAYAELNLGRIALQQNRLNEAASILDSTVAEFNTFGPAYRLLSQVYSQMGDEKKGNLYQVLAGDFESYIPPADPMFDALLLHSRNSDFILKQIDIAVKSRNFNWAISLNRQIFDYDPNDGESLSKLIMLSLDLRKLKGLEPLINVYLNMYKDNEGKLMEMANYNILRNQPQFARQCLDSVIKLNPKSLRAHLENIKILRLSQRLDDAKEYSMKILAENPNSFEVRNELGRVLILNGETAEAKRQFTISLRIEPKNEVALIMLGIMAKRNNDVSSALSYYKRAVAVNPQNSKTVSALVNYYLDLKRWNDAVALLTKTIETSPNDNDLLERYAWVLATCPDKEIRNPEMALSLSKRLEISKKAGPDQDVKAGIVLAVSYASLGNFAEAVKVCDKYIIRAKQIGMDSFITSFKYFKTQFEKNTALSL